VINRLTAARAQLGALLVGNGPGIGGKGAIGGTGTPVLIKKIAVKTVTVTPANPVVAATTDEQSLTVEGVAAGDVVILVPPTNLEASLVPDHGRVTAADTVKVRIANPTAGNIATAAKSWKVLWIQLV
jgi:hypothetical protein